ncbi:uncharacterized protein LAESUDRAFT_354422 [Laetiporus sulphureus 93-53]|uniref:Uncharacterized protein n=1 Tax=Laetiporus sulphureus 93-53 TaxID=1314785 RepID=A0A165GW19_9APHY|nr:uncharacterized protein LAESUDRAFT_354422 [Laetiporus sulphureus 93-53]KZT10903.1 hypothetical protein LAESUDRAFT_354422 [Laetiporus sulphureus 93-53]
MLSLNTSPNDSVLGINLSMASLPYNSPHWDRGHRLGSNFECPLIHQCVTLNSAYCVRHRGLCDVGLVLSTRTYSCDKVQEPSVRNIPPQAYALILRTSCSANISASMQHHAPVDCVRLCSSTSRNTAEIKHPTEYKGGLLLPRKNVPQRP